MEDRPEAATRIPNLMLAADFVRTHTDLATMEGANEAGAGRGERTLDRTGSPAPRRDVWRLHEPGSSWSPRAVDRLLGGACSAARRARRCA